MPAKRKVTPEDIWSIKFVSDPQISPCGTKVVFTLSETVVDKNGYQSAIWLVDESGAVRRLTYAFNKDKPVRDYSPRWSPDGRVLAFLSNRGGSSQLYILDLEGGEARRLTDKHGGVSEITWSPDGRKIAFTARAPKDEDAEKEQNPDLMVFRKLRYKFNGAGYLTDDRPRHIWTVDVKTGSINQITNTKYNDSSPTWSPDGKALAFTSCRVDDETVLFTDIWVQGLGDSEARKIAALNGPARAPRFSPDGRYLSFVGHNKGSKHSATQHLWVVPSAGGEPRCLTAELDRSIGSTAGSDVRFGGGNMLPEWNADSSCLYFTAADHGASRLYRVDLSGNVVTLTQEKHAITGFSVSEGSGRLRIAFTAEDPTHPGELYLYDDGEIHRLTSINDEVVQQWQLSAPENFTFVSQGGWEIEGWIMRPADFEDGKQYPVVVEIHGGPHAAYGWSFYHEFHLLNALGYGVIYTNPRGSRSYGEDFTHGVIGDWGGGDFADIMAAVDYVTNHYSWVDQERIGVTGGSYGGYLTNWIVTQTDRFKAAVTCRSISNLYTKYGVSDIGWYGNKAGMGGADLWDSEDFIMSRSPIRYAPNVRTPLLIIHSLEDYRCPFEQAEQFYVALKRLGNAPVEMVVFKGENHELSRSGKPRNRVERLQRICSWFEQYL